MKVGGYNNWDALVFEGDSRTGHPEGSSATRRIWCRHCRFFGAPTNAARRWPSPQNDMGRVFERSLNRIGSFVLALAPSPALIGRPSRGEGDGATPKIVGETRKRGCIIRFGMTAIEVLAATVLASLMMVSVLGVLRGLRAHEQVLDTRLPNPAWHRSLDEVLQYDLENARTFATNGTVLVLNGYSARSPDSQNQTWLPATIRYEVRSDAHRSWLVRRELPTGIVGAGIGEAQLVCAGIVAISVAAGDNLGGTYGGPTGTTANNGEEQPIGELLTVALLGESQNEPIYQFQFRRP